MAKRASARGKLYSYRLERLRSEDSSKIRWVARDDESLGYDIEDLSVTPKRRIDAKASTGRETRFILSLNEWDVAHHHGEDYEVHFWGGIDLTRPPAVEYRDLRRAGYPIIYKNVARQFAEGYLTAQPLQYLVQAVLVPEPRQLLEQ